MSIEAWDPPYYVDEARICRRDRAGLLAGLECLRLYASAKPRHHANVVDAVEYACEGLDVGISLCEDILAAIPRTRRGELTGNVRLTRARLGLLIRALLRADRGDFARVPRCPGCSLEVHLFEIGEVTDGPCPVTRRHERVRGAMPLWELAPPTRPR